MNLAPVCGLVRAAAELHPRLKVLFASSTTIVGIDHANPVNEAAADRPLTVYDRHKRRAEELLCEATRRGGLRACSLRLANVYGSGSPSRNAGRGVLNVMMARAARGEPLTLYGDGRYVRDFIHLDDVVAAFVAALRTPDILDGGHFVIATGQGHSLAQVYRWIADEARSRTGREPDIIRIAEPPDLLPIERRNFVGDASLFCRSTGWLPVMDLRGGIRHWFERHLGPTSAGAG
jgi:nucleoside-diphosphate-sugar epimerase